jgi:hypothetical protein
MGMHSGEIIYVYLFIHVVHSPNHLMKVVENYQVNLVLMCLKSDWVHDERFVTH